MANEFRQSNQSLGFLDGTGEMKRLFRECNWSSTGLGGPESWPQALKTAVDIILNSQFPMFISWGEKRIFLYNEAYSIILGQKHPSALGKKFYDVWSEIWPDIEPFILAVDRGESVYLEDLRLLMNRFGFEEETFFTFSYSPIRDDSDQLRGLFCAVVETTARKKGEIALRKSQDDLRATAEQLSRFNKQMDLLFQSSPAAISSLRRIAGDLVFEYVNPSYEKLVARKNLVGRKLYDVFPELPQMNSELYQIIESVCNEGKSFRANELEIKLDWDDSGIPTTRYIDISYEPVLNAEAKPEGLTTFAFDITNQVLLRQELAESERNFRVLFESAPGLYLVLKPDFTIVASSNAYNEATLTHREEILGRHVFDAFPDNPNDPTANGRSNLEASLNMVLSTKNSHTMALQKYDMRRPDGTFEEKWWSPVNSPILGASGEVAYIIHRAEDVTEFIRNRRDSGKLEIPNLADGATHMNAELFQRAHEIQDVNYRLRKALEDLSLAKEEAERANQLKSAFLANMSHEIRTPLGAILGFSTLLKEPDLTNEERDQYIETIVRNGNALTGIIDDILDLAKVEAGKLTLENIQVPIYQLFTETVDLFKDKARQKGIYLLLSIGEQVPQMIQTDPTRLRQILVNLIGNAVKFTESGGVRVSLDCEEIANDKVKLSVEVKDTGIGMTDEQRERLFQPFTQADNSTTRKFGGTGLGLVLSQRLAQALNGEIKIISSAVGTGSNFGFQFETAAVQKSSDRVVEDQVTPAESLESLKILVVEDSPDNQVLIKRLLNKRGAQVWIATDGREGVEKAKRQKFDVVLMDLQMPNMDGYQAKQALDHHGYDRPIIALTAHAMMEERRKTAAAGFADHLTKPIVAEELVYTILKQVTD